MLVKLGTLPIIPCLYCLGVSPHGMTLIGRAMHHELSKMKFFRGVGHYVRFLILFLVGFAIWIPATELISVSKTLFWQADWQCQIKLG